MRREIIIALVLIFVAVATAQAWEYEWGTSGNGGECAWGNASGCASVGGPPPPPPTSSCTFNDGTFGTDCTF